MKLATFLLPGLETPQAGEVRGNEVIAFTDGSSVVDRLASGDLTPADGAALPLADVTLLAPVPQPRAIFGIGLNYLAHAQEQGMETPTKPIVFMKVPGASLPPSGPVDPPAAARGRLDYEGELVVVMGAGNRIAGYAVGDDVSARDLQRSEPQWTRAKGFDSSCPWGPWVTTADAVPNPGDLRLQTWVNGEPRQDARTSDMIFDVEAIVAFVAEAVSFAPGDIILTGTPSGVGMSMDPRRFLGSGDTVRIEIETLGAIEHAVA